MATLKRLKSLYQPIKSADVKTFLDSVNQEQKRIALEKSMDSQLIKNISALAPGIKKSISDFTGKIKSKKKSNRLLKARDSFSEDEEFSMTNLQFKPNNEPITKGMDYILEQDSAEKQRRASVIDKSLKEVKSNNKMQSIFNQSTPMKSMATDVKETFKSNIRRNLPGVQVGFDNPEERLANPLPGIQKQLLDIIGSEYKTIINKMSPQIQSKMLFDAKQRQKLMQQPEVVVRPEDNY